MLDRSLVAMVEISTSRIVEKQRKIDYKRFHVEDLERRVDFYVDNICLYSLDLFAGE